MDPSRLDDYSSDSNAGSEASGSERLRTFAKVNRVVLDKNSEEYRKRRAKNNEAVRKSRDKSKMKAQETLERVQLLKQENEDLQQKIDSLNKELDLLKTLFRTHADSSSTERAA